MSEYMTAFSYMMYRRKKDTSKVKEHHGLALHSQTHSFYLFIITLCMCWHWTHECGI